MKSSIRSSPPERSASFTRPHQKPTSLHTKNGTTGQGGYPRVSIHVGLLRICVYREGATWRSRKRGGETGSRKRRGVGVDFSSLSAQRLDMHPALRKYGCA
jgi:hypothetical protein